jgi:hypothetical protein
MAGKLLMIKFVKMKKKIIFAVATGFFAVASVLNINMLQSGKPGDVSLDAIAVMAQANLEGDKDGSQEVDMKVEEVVYKKFDVKAGVWIFSSIGGEGWIKVTKTYSYKCCLPHGPGCGYGPC